MSLAAYLVFTGVEMCNVFEPSQASSPSSLVPWTIPRVVGLLNPLYKT